MTLHRWDDDQHILDDLSGAVRDAASLAGTIAEHGRGAYAWRTVDQDLFLACLDFDPSPECVRGMRSDPSDTRVLVFTASALSLEVEVMPGRVVGQVVPPGRAEIRVEAADGVTFHIEADDVGFFELPTVPRGPVRLRCDTAAGRLVTEWVRL